MHVDGIQEIETVSGYRVFLEKDGSLNADETKIVSCPVIRPDGTRWKRRLERDIGDRIVMGI